MRWRFLLVLVVGGWVVAGGEAFAQAEALASWNNGATKKAIVEFVQCTATNGDAKFVPSPQRTAAFDNDGTLWTERPIYFQFAFTIDRIKQLAPQQPDWQSREPFESIIAGDMAGFAVSIELST